MNNKRIMKVEFMSKREKFKEKEKK